ncbi:MATE family efflux transporter [uncultured Eubacterium sp.]|uniref:MATE family efflux transporter n=1 Tax=uncultured Eubacterium sp. TaxID=165185 RepID=UPI003263B9F6
MAWIGMLGSRAVAGVGVGGMYVWLSQGLSALAKMGGQVNVAQALGRGRRDEAGQYACSAVQLTVIFAVIFAFKSSNF